MATATSGPVPSTAASPDTDAGPGAADGPRARPSPAWQAGRFVAALIGFILGGDLIILAYRMAENSTSQTHVLIFWVGYLLELACVLLRVVQTRWAAEWWGWLIGLAALTFLPKLLMSLNGPVYLDEYEHYRHALDILRTGSLAATSHDASVIQYYPGLELGTIAVHEVTRLPVWASGQLLLFLAHLATLALIVTLGRTLGFTRGECGASAVIYALNPNFVYVDTQFASESLAIPLALLTVLCALRARLAVDAVVSARYVALGVVSAAATVATHHIASFFMVVACLLVTLSVPSSRNAGRRGVADISIIGPVAITLVAAAAVATSLTIVVRATARYLTPGAGTAFSQMMRVLFGQASDMQRSGLSAGGAPWFERYSADIAPILSTGIAILALANVVVNWRRERQISRLDLVFALIALAYPRSLFSLSSGGGDAVQRSWAFSYVGVALVAPAAWNLLRGAARRYSRVGAVRLLALVPLSVLAIGNIAAGQDADHRFPGPYAFGSDTRSRTLEQRNLDAWLDANVPVGAGVISDRVTAASIEGDTRLRVPGPTQTAVYDIFRDGPDLPAAVRRDIAQGNFRYFVLDTRILTQEPSRDFFDGYDTYRQSIDPAALARLGTTGEFTPIYRSANYIVYRIDLTAAP